MTATPINQLKREAIADLKAEWQARVDSLGHSLATMPPIDPDALAMAEAPAATCAGAVKLLDAVNARKDAA